MSTTSLSILVSGMLSGVPNQGGATWAVLQYILGLKRLGHDVYFVEPIAPEAVPASTPYFRGVVSEFGIAETSTQLVRGKRETLGLSYERVLEIARSADLLLNISGLLRDESMLERIPVRAYFDLDPVFTQLWHAQ